MGAVADAAVTASRASGTSGRPLPRSQPLGEGYRSQPVQTSPEDVDAVAVATAVTTALGAAAPQGVTPGHKTGNLLGLRDVSASASSGGGCGCGGH